MSPFFGVLTVLGAIAAGSFCVYIWKNIPVFQCPNCSSYNVEECARLEKDETQEFMRCGDCDHEWRAE